MLKNRHCTRIKETQQNFRYLDQGLSGWNLLERGVIVSCGTRRQSDISPYYSMDGDLVYWNNIQELMEEVQLDNTSGQWRLFTDLSKVRLMAVLLLFSAISLAHAVCMKEMCEKSSGFDAKSTLWTTPVEYMCWPKVIVMLTAARRIHQIMFFFFFCSPCMSV